MIYAFDLDGTLVDSHDLILQSYRDVGVEPPSDFFGKSWHEWLTDDAKHEAKNRRYLQLIPKLRTMPLFELFATLVDKTDSEVWVLTGASAAAYHAISNELVFGPTVRAQAEMTIDTKIGLMSKNGPGIMFEDDIRAAERMRKETKWTVYHSPR